MVTWWRQGFWLGLAVGVIGFTLGLWAGGGLR